MNSRAKQLEPAVEQARQRSEAALAQLATQQQLLARAEHQLAELQRYRLEYAAAGDAAQSVTALLNRQQFVERIDRAIVQQQAELDRQHRQLSRLRGRAPCRRPPRAGRARRTHAIPEAAMNIEPALPSLVRVGWPRRRPSCASLAEGWSTP